MKIDATFTRDFSTIDLHVASPRGAKWIARHSTTNIAGTIHYAIDRGQEIIRQMQEDGLIVQEAARH